MGGWVAWLSDGLMTGVLLFFLVAWLRQRTILPASYQRVFISWAGLTPTIIFVIR